MTLTLPSKTLKIAVIIGAGPAGLMAAQELAAAGYQVDVFDAMPSVGRKFLLAGIGGLNLTHAEAFAPFAARYGSAQAQVEPLIGAFGADELRAWAAGLGIETFVGTSGRVFPKDMKAAPLLRAWLTRLRASGVRFHARHKWLGWDAQQGVDTVAQTAGTQTQGSKTSRNKQGKQSLPAQHALRFATPQGEQRIQADCVVLALGGASWPRLGSDGAWLPWLRARGVEVADLQPSNCGFDCSAGQIKATAVDANAATAAASHLAPVAPVWSAHLQTKYAGQPLKSIALRFESPSGAVFDRQGECVLTQTGLEGSLVYAASALLRDAISVQGSASFSLDLLPAHTAEHVAREVAHPRGTRSWSSHLKSRLNLHGVKVALLHEVLSPTQFNNAALLAHTIKALPITAHAARPIAEAISSAGGVRWQAMDAGLMLKALPGVFCAGEMLDWEAPTGGYLLTACFASGRAAGQAAANWLTT